MSALRPVAAVDCGTNSTRLLVAGDDGRPLARLMRITRLGQGVDATRQLHPDAVARTLDVLREYRGVMESHGVERVRMTATSAARDALNRDSFFGPATEVVGVAPELLSGEEEGRLAFAGAVSELDPAAGPYLVLDIGGGSTEFAVGPGQGAAEAGGMGPGPAALIEPEGAVSVDLGCVRVTERFLHSDPPAPEELSQAISVVRSYLDDVERELPLVKSARRLVGLAGTVTTVAAVEIGLAVYDRDRIHPAFADRRQGQTGEVGEGRTGGQRATPAGRQPDELAQPVQGDRLHRVGEARRGPHESVLVEHGHEAVEANGRTIERG